MTKSTDNTKIVKVYYEKFHANKYNNVSAKLSWNTQTTKAHSRRNRQPE